VLALSALAALTTIARAQPTAEQRRRADSVFAEFSGGDSPGAAIAVVRDGKVLFTNGYGLADLEHRIPITPATVFDVASVSKQFTGLAVAMLIAEGKVALTDDIRKYIPEMAVRNPPITVNHLLHHTSGLRDWPGTLGVAGWRFDDVISFEQILTMAYHQQSLNFAPGAEYTYSNTGYNLLAELVQRVRGTSFRVWMNEQFFRPLGMKATVFRDDHTLVVPQRAFGYARTADGQWHATTNNLTALGSSSLMSSADDMARWLINFDDTRVGGARAMALMRTRGVLNDGSSIPYAFGIGHGLYRGAPTLSHSGSWASFVSFVLHFPQLKAGVVVLANTPRVNTARAANALADIFLGDALNAPVPTATSLGESVVIDRAMLDRHAGVYRLGPGWYVRIRREGDRLIAQVPGEGPAPMVARSAQEFWVPNYNAGMVFAASAAGPTPSLTYRGRPAPRVDEAGLTAPASLAQYAGVYESAELGIAYPIEVVGDSLVLRSRQHGTVRLTHRWRDDFSSPVYFFRSVNFQRDATGRVTGMLVNVDERTRNILFTRR
jgi:CubicO group peptidase (beta-lactamase class C family)